MSEPTPTPAPSLQNPDATLISSPHAEVPTHSSFTPQEHTSPGETNVPAPGSAAVDVGSQLGPYKLVDKLGEGGMGAVFKARHTKLGKFVAMKILPQHVMSRSDALARFEREMLAVGSLHHPNIVQAHDAGEFDGVHYLSMEYVEGQDLQQLVKARGPMSVVNACKAIRQAAQGLAAAHKLGLVHRDIKPSNLFVTKQAGQIKILDMGLALLSQEEVPAALTSTGQCFGTPDYMAPEQWSDAHTCDGRADLYSLGCTLFFLLVGHPPYHSETHRTAANKMKGHVIDPIPDLLAARSGLPEEVNAIYRKLMAKDPKDRFASADQLAEALVPFTKQNTAVQSNSSQQSTTKQIDPPRQADSNPATLAPTHDSATLNEVPADPLGATSTWNGGSAASRQRSPVGPQPETTSQAASPIRPNRNRLFIAGGAVALVLLLGVIIITITNKAGTKTRIEVPGDSKVEITTDSTNSVSRAASDHGKTESHVNEPAGKSVFDLNRETAEWAHGRGATLVLVPDGVVVLPADELPKTPFIVAHSFFRAGANVTNLELDPLKRVQHLRAFGLASPKPPEGLFDVLQQQPRLYQLEIESAGMRTSDIARSKPWDTLLSLFISVSPNNLDDEWRFLERCPSLQRLVVGGTEQLPNLLKRLSDVPNLRNLDLYHATTVDEQAVAALQAKNSHLRVTVGKWAESRVVGRDPVRDAIQVLLGQNAKVFGINYGRGVPEAITLDNLNDATPWVVNEIHLEATTRCTEENQHHLQSLDSGQWLTLIAHQNVDADEWARAISRRRLVLNFVAQGDGLTDAGLAHLQHAIDIPGLCFSGSRVTRAGLERFRRVHPTCTITCDLGKFEPDYAAVPEPISPKQSSTQQTGWHGWPADAPKPAIAPFNAEQAKKHQEEWAAYLNVPVEYTNSIGMKLRLIPPGEFLMGSSDAEVEAAAIHAVAERVWTEHIRSERPAHKVILTQPFYLGRHEVTQSQFARVTGENPSHFASTGKGREIVEGLDTGVHPVEMVAWNDAFEFCNKLSLSEGVEIAFDPSQMPADLRLQAGYRLPTEGEWEFACRAGTDTRFWTGDDPVKLTEAAWFQEPLRTQPVGLLRQNPFGLCDVHGNVWEWVFDFWAADYYGRFAEQRAINPIGPETSTKRGIRGGLFSFNPAACRSAGRHATDSTFKHESIGFRTVVSVNAVREAMRRQPKLGWHDWPADAPKPAIAPFNTEQAKKHQEEWATYLKVPVEFTNSIGMKFRLIPPGEFTMGSSQEEIEAALKNIDPNDKHWQESIQGEAPQHRVILTQPIYLGVSEVTQAEYVRVAGTNPSWFAPMGNGKDVAAGQETTDLPAERINWLEAAEYCTKLSQQERLKPIYSQSGETVTLLEGTGYRLPSEAEWEFACRAGTASIYSFGDNVKGVVSAGWFVVNSGERTHAVRKLKSNPFGLYDVHGNVWELLQDGWEATFYGQFREKTAMNPISPFSADSRHVMRGGAFNDDGIHGRSSVRNHMDSTSRFSNIGFRVAVSVDAVRQVLKLTGPAMPKAAATSPSAPALDPIDSAAER
ncbi:MAG: bifunctional serine/threonine-protein kinase/formylglycine-generating enzyme family protein [Planctomycetaceae bacterium]